MEFMKTYQNLDRPNKEALDEAIMDQGITDYESLTKAMGLANTFLCEATSRLTFEQFQRSKVAQIKNREWCQDQGLDVWTVLPVLMYDTECYIVIVAPGDYNLIIGNCEWRSNNLESLERILYDRWYC